MEWRERNGVRWLEAKMHGAHAAFTTRLGGVSEPPFDTLNLGILTDDSEDAVRENRRRLGAALGVEPSSVPIALQVHGAEILEHGLAPQERSPFAAPGSPPPEADGHVIREPGLTPLVFVADCLPIALLGPHGLALLHCGWRPMAAGIVAKGAAMVGATEAVVGPGIGPCCYEVGDEVLGAFAHLGDGVATGRMLDLPEVARRLLATAGVRKVESAGLCTSCESELFFSHRRDGGRTGRQAGLAWLNPIEFPTGEMPLPPAAA
jgi:hypothetical protein